MFPVTDFLEIGWVVRIFFVFCFFFATPFCAAKQNKQILHEQYAEKKV